MQPPTPAHEDLTPEQYETIKPLLKLADLGNSQNPLTERLKPAEIQLAESKRRFLEALRIHGTVSHASAAAGVARTTAWRWRRDDDEFRQEVDRWMRQDQVDELHESMFKIATSNDPKMANAAVRAGEFLLQALDRNTYGATLKTESTQTINVQIGITMEARNELRAEQLAKVNALRTLSTLDEESFPK